MSGRFVGRFAVIDGPGRTHTRVHDAAGMTRIATFPGEHYSAERDGGELHIYAHHDEHGQPAKRFGREEGTTGIRSSAGSSLVDTRAGRHAENPRGPQSIADLRRIHDAYFAALRRA